MRHTRGKNRLKLGFLLFFGGAVRFRTPFPIAYFTSSLPFSLCAICPSYVKSFVMGMVSAQREVLRFVGMGSVQRSLPRRVVVLVSHTQKIQGDSTVTSLQYARDFVTQFTSDW